MEATFPAALSLSFGEVIGSHMVMQLTLYLILETNPIIKRVVFIFELYMNSLFSLS